MTAPKNSPAGAQTIQRAVHLLKFLARNPEHGFRLQDVARYLEIERPTAHRGLQALCAEGLVTRAPGRRYRVGPLLFELAVMAGGHGDLTAACTPELRELAEVTGDTSFFFLRHGDDAICLAREQGSYHIQTPVIPVGGRHPLGVSSGGLAIIAALPEAEVVSVLEEVAPRLIAFKNLQLDELLVRIHEARRSGYAVIADHAAPGVCGVGVPIYNTLGHSVAAVTVATTKARMTPSRIHSVVPLLQAAAGRLASMLG